MPHASPDPYKGLNQQFQLRSAQSAFAQLAIHLAGFDDPADGVAGFVFRCVRWKGAQGGFAAIGQHQNCRLP